MAVKKLERLHQLAQVFTPSAPIRDYDLFAGRMDQIITLFSVLNQPGQHAALYGERGVGKTSLANIVGDAFQRHQGHKVTVVRVNCGMNDDFATLWHSVFKRLPGKSLDPHQELGKDDVLSMFEDRDDHPLIIIDELDRFTDDDGLTELADTVKDMSDHAVPATLMLVGVGDSVANLIGDHLSVERALVQIQMPRMSMKELGDSIDKGLSRVQMTITPPAKARIARLSEGLPAITHLLSQHAGMSAVEDDRDKIDENDVERATKRAMTKDQHSILVDYQHAVRSPRKHHLFAEVLLACALAQKDELGHFSARNARKPLCRITGRDLKIPAFSRHLDEFTKDSHSSVLQKEGPPRKVFFRFSKPMMQPYVIMKALADGKLTEEMLDEFRPRPPKDLFEGQL